MLFRCVLGVRGRLDAHLTFARCPLRPSRGFISNMEQIWKSVTLVASLAIISWTSVAVASEDHAGLQSEIRYGSATVGAEWNALNAAWTGYVDVLDRQTKLPSSFLIEKVVEERNKLGVPNLFDHSGALVRQAKRFYRSGDVQGALQLAQYARQLSPDDPTPYLAASSFSNPDGKGDLGRRVGDFRDGVLRIYRSVSERGRWIGKTSSILLFVALLVLLLSLLGLLIRYMPLLSRDVADRTLPGIEPFHIALCGWILVFAPLAFRLPLGIVALILGLPRRSVSQRGGSGLGRLGSCWLGGPKGGAIGMMVC